MIKLVLGTFLSALAIFAFGAVFWMSPIHEPYVGKTKSGDEAVGRFLREEFPQAGYYRIPGVQANDDETVRLHRAGPVATIHFRPEGVEPMAPSVMIRGFLHGWVTVALLALVLRLATPATYGSRVLLVAVAGAAGVVYTRLGDGIWWFQPWPWLILTAAYGFAVFLIAGLVLAAFVKPTPAVTS
jgi:hypothetical protein